MPARVLVAGGGVIGLSCAWQLARAGHDVTLIAPDPGHDGASWVAAGMLAPVTEAQFGEHRLTALLVEGAAEWKEFATALEHAVGSGTCIGYDERGTVSVALTASDRDALDALLAYQHELGLVAHRRSASECRALVPALAPTCRGGTEVPGDHFVADRVDRVDGGPAPEVELADSGGRIGADVVVVAAGIGSPSIKGLAEAGLPEVRPVKGHIVRLGPGPGPGATGLLLARTVRGLVHGRSVYLVPRPDRTLVVGATVEERGHDTTVQAGAVHQLLSDARAIVPGIDELELLEAQAGLRPATPDNTPCIGWTRVPGVAVATGHYRNGILLAPLTAAAICALVAGETLGPVLAGLAPS
jgi:glycine oxidase